MSNCIMCHSRPRIPKQVLCQKCFDEYYVGDNIYAVGPADLVMPTNNFGASLGFYNRLLSEPPLDIAPNAFMVNGINRKVVFVKTAEDVEVGSVRIKLQGKARGRYSGQAKRAPRGKSMTLKDVVSRLKKQGYGAMRKRDPNGIIVQVVSKKKS